MKSDYIVKYNVNQISLNTLYLSLLNKQKNEK